METEALRRLQALGLIRQRWNWQGPMTRYQLAAFFHKLFWDPNPPNAVLPAYQEADLTDAARFYDWVRETPPRIVGLGLMQPIDDALPMLSRSAVPWMP